MAQKITHWLLIALVFSLGFGQLLRFENFGVPIYLHDVIILVLLANQVTILVKNYKDRNFVILPGIKLFLVGLSLGWLFALLHYPPAHLLIPSLYTLRLLAYLALYFVLRHSELSLGRQYFHVSGLICLVIGLLQYLLLPDMRIFQYLGWDDHLSRLTLPHFDPTFTAVMLGLFVFTLKRPQWFLGIMVIWSILLTYSRSTWLSLALTALFFVKNTKIFLISLFLFLICITFWLPKKFGEGTNLFRTYSISSRITSDRSVVQNLGWNLVIGQGMNTFPRNSINNSYLYLLATSGIIGLIGWGMFMFSLFQKSAHKSMLIFFFVASLFNNVMFYPFALLWVLLMESNSKKL